MQDSRPPYPYGGNALTVAFLVFVTSPESMRPLASTSNWKVCCVGIETVLFRTAVTSPESVRPVKFTSPSRTPIVLETAPVLFWESSTLLNVTVRYCWLATPTRFTVHWFAAGPLLRNPVLALPQLVTLLTKLNTIL